MMRIRHWKQRYLPGAKMVWAREMKFNGKTVKQGEEITEEQKALLGEHRLKKWWDSKIIQLWTIEMDAETAADEDPEDLVPEDETEDTPEDAPEDPEVDAEAEEAPEDPEDDEDQEEAEEAPEEVEDN